MRTKLRKHAVSGPLWPSSCRPQLLSYTRGRVGDGFWPYPGLFWMWSGCFFDLRLDNGVLFHHHSPDHFEATEGGALHSTTKFPALKPQWATVTHFGAVHLHFHEHTIGHVHLPVFKNTCTLWQRAPLFPDFDNFRRHFRRQLRTLATPTFVFDDSYTL